MTAARFWYLLGGFLALPVVAVRGVRDTIWGRSCPGCGVRPGGGHWYGCALGRDGMPWA